MEERDILLKTIETLNASIATLSENHKKEVDSLNERIKELTAQVAWLNRQLFGRKSKSSLSSILTILTSSLVCCLRMHSR